jgi:hypothetical protein
MVLVPTRTAPPGSRCSPHKLFAPESGKVHPLTAHAVSPSIAISCLLFLLCRGRGLRSRRRTARFRRRPRAASRRRPARIRPMPLEFAEIPRWLDLFRLRQRLPQGIHSTGLLPSNFTLPTPCTVTSAEQSSKALSSPHAGHLTWWCHSPAA